MNLEMKARLPLLQLIPIPRFSSTWKQPPPAPSTCLNPSMLSQARTWKEYKGLKPGRENQQRKQTEKEQARRAQSPNSYPFCISSFQFSKLLIKRVWLHISFLCLVLIIALVLLEWVPKDIEKI